MNDFKFILSAVAGAVQAAASDADVTAYASAVTSAGGSLPTAHRQALGAAIGTLKASTAWAKIKELWLPLGANGDLTTARVKFKNGAPLASVTLPNAVSGDYTTALGFDPGITATNKKVSTDFNPSLHGSLTASDWGMSVYVTRELSGTAGLLGGTATGTATYLGYEANSTSKIAGSNSISLTPNGEPWKFRRLSSVQIGGGQAAGMLGGLTKSAVANATPAAPNSTLDFLSCNGALFGNAAIGGYAVHQALTGAELRALQAFFDSVSVAIGRLTWTDTLVAAGDSYVAPTPIGPTSAAASWPAVAATARGWDYSLQGVPSRGWDRGQTTGTTTMVGANGRNVALSATLGTMSKHVVFPLGINDAHYNVAGTAVSASAAAVLQMLADIGYPAEYLRLATNYWSSSVAFPARMPEVAQAIRDTAASFGVGVIDFYAGRTFGDAAASDGTVHMNNYGHTQLAADFAAMSGW